HVRHHVFHIAPSPTAALTIATLLLGPLIARVHGGPATPPAAPHAILAEPHRATDDRTWAIPVALADDDQGRPVATVVSLDGPDDLMGFARASALALLPPRSGPWQGGEVVRITLLEPGLSGG